MNCHRIRLLPLLLLGGLVAFLGCSGDGLHYADVQGTVTWNGKPLPEVEIVFLPDPTLGTEGPSASAYTDQQGNYRLWCERGRVHGAIVGNHRVCIHDIAAIPAPPESIADPREGPGGYRPRPLRVPPRYSAVAHTPFQKVTVCSGSNKLDFDVKSIQP